MVTRNVFAGLAAAGLVLGSTAAAAAPVAADDAARVGSPVASAEGATGSAWPWLLLVLIVVGVIGVIAAGNNEETPRSP